MKRRETSWAASYGLLLTFVVAMGSAGCNRHAEPPNERPPVDTKTPVPHVEASVAPPSSAPSATGVRLLVREEVVPGKLWVTVYVHEESAAAGVMQLWTYASEGLWAHKQREIRFSVKREPDEAETAFSRQPFELYRLIYNAASEGKFVDVHGRTILKGTPLLGRDDFHCILYGPPQPIGGIDAKAPFLSAVFVTCDEEQVGGEAGYARIFARLGSEARFFPTAYWTDRKRSPVVRPGERSESLFSQFRGVHVGGASVYLARKGGLANKGRESFFHSSDRIVLSIRPRAVDLIKRLASVKESENALLMLLEMDPTAGTCLVWYPGQKGLRANTSPAAITDRTTGNFILLAGQGKDAQTNINEDGYTLFFPEATWKLVREALAAGKPITIPGKDNVPEFVVEYVPATYDSPIDGTRYQSREGWTTYTPEGGVKKSSGAADMAGIVLLTDQTLIAERTNVQDVTSVMDAIKTIVETQVGTSKGEGSEIMIECELLPGKNKKFAMAQRPTVDRVLLQGIYDKLEKIAIPEVTGSVKFQVNFKLHGGISSESKTP